MAVNAQRSRDYMAEAVSFPPRRPFRPEGFPDEFFEYLSSSI
jgi:hypothetical protein